MNNKSYNSHSSSNSSVYRAIRERLIRLEFRAFQTCVILWLGAKGYRHIRSLGRHSARGRRRIGGADFIAELPGPSNVRVAIQIRLWRTPVQRRAIDELWGFMLRSGIPSGLVVTNNEFFPAAIKATHQFPGRPIRLVSVAQLAGSMAGLGLGVRRTGTDWADDDSFFRTLEALKLGLESHAKVDDGFSLSATKDVKKNGRRSSAGPWFLFIAGVLFLLWLLVMGAAR